MQSLNEQNLSREAIASGKPVVVLDAENDPRTDKPAVEYFGDKSLLIVPLSVGDRLEIRASSGMPRMASSDEGEPVVPNREAADSSASELAGQLGVFVQRAFDEDPRMAGDEPPRLISLPLVVDERTLGTITINADGGMDSTKRKRS